MSPVLPTGLTPPPACSQVRMPRTAFFACENIKKGEELTYDYGYVKGGVEGESLRCYCGSKPNSAGEGGCRGWLY